MSHTIISPPPYSPAGITPSNSMYSTGWILDVDRELLVGGIRGDPPGDGP